MKKLSAYQTKKNAIEVRNNSILKSLEKHMTEMEESTLSTVMILFRLTPAVSPDEIREFFISKHGQRLIEKFSLKYVNIRSHFVYDDDPDVMESNPDHMSEISFRANKSCSSPKRHASHLKQFMWEITLTRS